jgi:hypothetical protein
VVWGVPRPGAGKGGGLVGGVWGGGGGGPRASV